MLIAQSPSPDANKPFPWMTASLALGCLLASVLYALLTGPQQQVVIATVGASPAEVHALLSGERATGWNALWLSLFFHSSWLHLAGNVIYLWVFGLPVERRMGPLALLSVFLLGGVLAHLLLSFQLPTMSRSVIGASGAVSAVVGACAGLYPRRRIGLYLPLGVVVEFVRLPTLLVVGSWFALQLLYSVVGPTSGAMAWWTHLAGFGLGLGFALLARAVDAVRSNRQGRQATYSD
ncbi:MAG: rhomboid family intramembrane serine protease [Pseudomonadota bacterium]